MSFNARFVIFFLNQISYFLLYSIYAASLTTLKIFDHFLQLAFDKASHFSNLFPSNSKPKNLEVNCANFIKTKKKANCKLICQQFLIKLRKKGNNFQELLMIFEWFSRMFIWKIADSIKNLFYWGKTFEPILLSREIFPFWE